MSDIPAVITVGAEVPVKAAVLEEVQGRKAEVATLELAERNNLSVDNVSKELAAVLVTSLAPVERLLLATVVICAHELAEEHHVTAHSPVKALSDVNSIDMTPVEETTGAGKLGPVNGPASRFHRPWSSKSVILSYWLPVLNLTKLRFTQGAAGGAMVQNRACLLQ